MMSHVYQSSRFRREATNFLCISTFGIGLAWLPAQAPSVAKTCNPFGCPASPQDSSAPPSSRPPNAATPDRRNFTVYNNTRQTVIELYVSSTDSDSWGSDIMSGVFLPSGSSTAVTFSNRSNRCIYDVKAVYRDRTYDTVRSNLCKTPSINFTESGGDYAPR
jgi:hypothetical protein